MESKTCRFCAEEIQATAVVCKHCRSLVAEGDIENLARNWWGEYTEDQRCSIWEGLSDERKQSLKATIDLLTRQYHDGTTAGRAASVPRADQAPAARKKTQSRPPVSAEIEYLARNWRSFSERLRADWWTRLSSEERLRLQAKIDDLTLQAHSNTPARATAPVVHAAQPPAARKKTHRLLLGCLVLFLIVSGLGFLGLLLDTSHRPSAVPSSTVAPGFAQSAWIDERTGLTWTARDNGSPISGDGARAYCRSLVLDGSGWQQPTIDELSLLFDPTLPMREGMPRITQPVQLSSPGCWVWSATLGKDFSTPSALMFGFVGGRRTEAPLGHTDRYARALCVRRGAG